MPEFVRCHDNTGESSGVLHDSHAVYLLQPLVYNTGSAHIGKPSCATVTVAVSSFTPAHIQLGDGNGDVVHGKASLQEQIFAHISQS